MIVPEDSGIGLEDGLRALRLNTPAVLKMIPLSSLDKLEDIIHEKGGEKSVIQKAIDSRFVNDEKAFKHELRAIVITLVRDIVIMAVALIALAEALILVFRLDKSRKPQPIKEKRRYAV